MIAGHKSYKANLMTGALAILLLLFATIMHMSEFVPVYAQVVEPDVPGAPTGVGLERARESLVASWSAPSDDGGRRVIAYGVHWQESGQPWGGSSVNLRWTDSSPYTIPGLSTGTAYDVRVYAQNAVGLSDPSVAVSGSPAVKSSAPAELKLVGGEDSSITVSWAAPPNTGGMPIEHYVVRWKSGDEDWPTDRQSNTTLTSYTITGLNNGTEYDVQVVPVTGNNWWGDSARVTGIAGFRPPGAPTGVSLERARDSLIVNWSAPSDDGGRRVIAYGVQWQESGQPWTGGAVNLRWTGSSPYTIADLTMGTTYDVRVFAQNAKGLSAPSDSAVGRPADRSTGPTQLRVTGGADSSLTLIWTAPSDTGGTPISHYLVMWKSGEEDWSGERQAETTSTSYTITSLDNGTEYVVRLVPVTSGNLWGISATVTDVAGFRPPGAPTDVALERGQESLVASWAAPSDDGGRRVIAYGVQWQVVNDNYSGRFTPITLAALVRCNCRFQM